MVSDAYTIAWAAGALAVTILLFTTRCGKYLRQKLWLEIPKSPLPAECCPTCCHHHGAIAAEVVTLRRVLEKHCRETPARQKEVAEELSSVIVAGLRDVFDSDRALTREMMREDHALERESISRLLGERLSEDSSQVKEQ